MEQNKHRILFQGDSITDGARSRNEDKSHLVGASYAFKIAGKLSYELAEKTPVFMNRGISGNRVSDLYARWNEDAISLNPTLISFLIGVNDAWRYMAKEPSGVTDRFERAYRHLLEETREVLPDTGLIICEPFILKTGVTAENWDAMNDRLQKYQERSSNLAKEFDAVFVPLQDAFNEASKMTEAHFWLWDGVHPTPAGHELIAREWLSVVQKSKLAII
ncbi:SGNH/GDSL hydrolase family protein [Litchfieldia alkalitelluris]|uniref:SGNH/GDSL hydrolase family protein n=1 Tax=Litchfieldia alkalitelluris TaxID=304268 RepID=UPI0009965927|nr:SGNH/GDSL hydrolase family protein [Litchfieldia alkalitelluris]